MDVQGMATQGAHNLQGPPLALDLTLLRKDEEVLLHDLDAFLTHANLDRLEGGPVTVMTQMGALEDVAHSVGALQVRLPSTEVAPSSSPSRCVFDIVTCPHHG